jgi:hypothetical protein
MLRNGSKLSFVQLVLRLTIVDDVLKNLGLKDDGRVQASNSEILTIAILAFLFFGGNFKKALSESCSITSLLKSLIQGF